MKRFLTSLFGGKAVTNLAKPAALRFQPCLEKLENRQLMAAYISSLGNLCIVGTAANDTWELADRTDSYGRQVLRVSTYNSSGALETKDFLTSQVPGIIKFWGYGGNDYVNAGQVSSRGVQAWGGDGNDTLVGSQLRDILYGNGGNDGIDGQGGNDALYGGAGDDGMYGGAGADWMEGGDGNDYMSGGAGNDALYGNLGADNLNGDLGNDYLDGGKDGFADTLRGGGGSDTFVAELYFEAGAMRHRDSIMDYFGGNATYAADQIIYSNRQLS